MEPSETKRVAIPVLIKQLGRFVRASNCSFFVLDVSCFFLFLAAFQCLVPFDAIDGGVIFFHER